MTSGESSSIFYQSSINGEFCRIINKYDFTSFVDDLTEYANEKK